MMRIISISSCLLMVLFCLTSLISTTLLGGGVVALDYRCGKYFSGVRCPSGLCCSETGYCGKTDAHCKYGCQSQCYDPAKCGYHGETKCGNGLCCSNWGFCGTGDAYCSAANCQSQCPKATLNEGNHVISSALMGGDVVGLDYRCGKYFSGVRCPSGLCCSQTGYCGKTDAHCKYGCQSQCYDPAKCGYHGETKCGNGLCCSNWGFCGTGDAYCSAANCQSQCPNATFNGRGHGSLIELPLGTA